MRRRSFSKGLATALAAALLASAAPLHGARADESAEAEIGVPPAPSADERMSPEKPTETPPMTQTGSPTTAPVEPAAPAPPAVTSQPVEAVSRPGGAWGPVAIAADLLVMRPIGLLSLVPAAAAFVAVSPVAAATGTLGDRVGALRDRAENVFTRPLGAL
ncbi:MAG: hypothetical protein DCC71_23540 [Proteobacteria bacterium]|nr:MAG: hypothetical protein DCC71_23540 [Pseudomonadota bacterium]